MGIKDLWSVLTPYAERKPINELHGKVVAIDLAGWVCESLNVVDYFIHPKHYLKNLFFRTCYLLWEDVVPVFVLDGIAPELKNQVIRKRNDINFRGAKPCEKKANAKSNATNINNRSNFNRTLEQCKSMLTLMGIQCVQAPGEAESYCAWLNKRGLVAGVISQDSDCFAYGALCVFRNFSVSMQGKMAAQGGAIDIYDAQQIFKELGLGQNKYIAMALLCGCDYCPEGVGGIGKEGVLNLFKKFEDSKILDRIRSWRKEDGYYNAVEMRVNDKSICTNCGHKGRTQSHIKSGCDVCRTYQGCDATLWKDERESLKSELMLRKKALAIELFPNEEIVAEFLSEPVANPNLTLNWKQPNIVKFIQRFGTLLQWPEIYCFQKFLPILTRWQLQNANQFNLFIVEPQKIIRKRTIKGIPSLEIMWQDKNCNIDRKLIPEDQLLEFEDENSKSRQELWITVEPLGLVEKVYYELVVAFFESIASKKSRKKGEITTSKRRIKKTKTLTIDKFLTNNLLAKRNSTPLKLQRKNDSFISHFPSDLESDYENLDISNIVSDIVNKEAENRLQFNIPKTIISKLIHADDNDLIADSRKSSILKKEKIVRTSLDDSFDVLMKHGTDRLNFLNNLKYGEKKIREDDLNESSFFETPNNEDYDVFEIALNISQGLQGIENNYDLDSFE